MSKVSSMELTASASAKFQWLRRVALDKDTLPLAKSIAMLFATVYMHTKNGGGAWPSVSTIADETGYSVRSVRDALGALVERRHLIREERPAKTSIYYPGPGPGVGSLDAEKTDEPGSGLPPTRQNTAVDPAAGCRQIQGKENSESNTGKLKHSKMVAASPLPSAGYGKPKVENDLFEDNDPKHAGEKSTPANAKVKAKFDEWYRLYPRQAAPERALSAYRKALKRGADSSDLLAGVIRFAAGWTARYSALNYVPYPSKWLSDGQWKEEWRPVSKPELGAMVSIEEQIARAQLNQAQRNASLDTCDIIDAEPVKLLAHGGSVR